MKVISKPLSGEYDPYTIRYINLLPDDGLILKYLADNASTTSSLLLSLSDEQLRYRYEPGKWTIKDILQHITDDERVFAYRALRIARNDQTPLPGFDQDPYVVMAEANNRSIGVLVQEFLAVRTATVALFTNLPDEAWNRTGTANNHAVSVRALAYILAGHEVHHRNIITKKYLHK